MNNYLHPDVWADNCFEMLSQLLQESGVSAENVYALGTCGHAAYVALMDEEGKALCESACWFNGPHTHKDVKADREIAELKDKVGEERLVSIAAKSTSKEALGPMLMWYRNNHPEIYAKCRKAVYGKDYITYALTGRAVIDVSDASSTLIFDVEHRCWSDELVAAAGLDPAVLPDVCECSETVGYVTEEGAKRSGLKVGMRVVAGLTNKASIAIGGRAYKDGASVPAVSRSCNIVAATSKYVADPAGRASTYCSAVPGGYYVVCDTKTSGGALGWYGTTYHGDIFQLPKGKGGTPFAGLEELIKQSAPGANGVVFLPHLDGTGAPYYNDDAKGVFFGITPKTTEGDMLRAAMEATGFQTRDCMDYLDELGVKCDDNNYHMWGTAPYWQQVLAETTGRAAKIMAGGGPPVLGGAMMAAIGAGFCVNVEEAVELFCKDVITCEPTEKYREVYDHNYAVYKALCKALAPVYKLAAEK